MRPGKPKSHAAGHIATLQTGLIANWSNRLVSDAWDFIFRPNWQCDLLHEILVCLDQVTVITYFTTYFKAAAAAAAAIMVLLVMVATQCTIGQYMTICQYACRTCCSMRMIVSHRAKRSCII